MRADKRDISKLIKQLWSEEKLPLIGGLLLAGGAIYKDVMVNAAREPASFCLDGRDYSVQFSYITLLQTVEYKDFRIHCGGGSHGADGFVLALNARGELLWLLMDEINPIERMTIESGTIHAFNNNWQKFTIPVFEPQKYSVTDV